MFERYIVYIFQILETCLKTDIIFSAKKNNISPLNTKNAHTYPTVSWVVLHQPV